MADPATDKPQTTSVEPTEPRRSAGTSFLWLLAALVLYILSIGPVVKLNETFHIAENNPRLGRCIGTFYAPLAWCAPRNSSPFGKFILWYLHTVWRMPVEK
jgi:hypothetical protein